MRSKAWLAARMPIRLARLPRTATSAQRLRRLRSTRAAAPVLLAHAEVIKCFQWAQNLGTLWYYHSDTSMLVSGTRLSQYERIPCTVSQAAARCYEPSLHQT